MMSCSQVTSKTQYMKKFQWRQFLVSIGLMLRGLMWSFTLPSRDFRCVTFSNSIRSITLCTLYLAQGYSDLQQKDSRGSSQRPSDYWTTRFGIQDQLTPRKATLFMRCWNQRIFWHLCLNMDLNERQLIRRVAEQFSVGLNSNHFSCKQNQKSVPPPLKHPVKGANLQTHSSSWWLKRPTMAVCVNIYTTPLHNADAVIWPFNGLLSPQRGPRGHSAPWTEAARRSSAWSVLFCSLVQKSVSCLLMFWCAPCKYNLLLCAVWFCSTTGLHLCLSAWEAS